MTEILREKENWIKNSVSCQVEGEGKSCNTKGSLQGILGFDTNCDFLNRQYFSLDPQLMSSISSWQSSKSPSVRLCPHTFCRRWTCKRPTTRTLSLMSLSPVSFTKRVFLSRCLSHPLTEGQPRRILDFRRRSCIQKDQISDPVSLFKKLKKKSTFERRRTLLWKDRLAVSWDPFSMPRLCS